MIFFSLFLLQRRQRQTQWDITYWLQSAATKCLSNCYYFYFLKISQKPDIVYLCICCIVCIGPWLGQMCYVRAPRTGPDLVPLCYFCVYLAYFAERMFLCLSADKILQALLPRSISHSILPSPVDKTLSNPQRAFHHFWLRAKASDLEEHHISLQAALAHTEGHGFKMLKESHLQKMRCLN